MSEWREYKLDEIYDFGSGLSKPRNEFGFGYGFLSFKEIFNNYFVPDTLKELVNSTEWEQKSCSIQRGDVFLTRTSETDEDLGMSCVALKDYPKATFNGFTKRLRPKGKIEVLPEFAGFFFRNQKFRAAVTGISSITTRASLNNDMLSSLTMQVPPIDIQIKIAETLKSIHDKIDLLHRQNQTLEKMAETLFRQWFVEEAKEDREDGTFGNWINGTLGGDWGKEEQDANWTKAVCCIRGTDISDLNNGIPAKTPVRFIKESKFQSIYPKEGDLIIEISGGTENQSTGRICYINEQIKRLFDYPLVFSNFCRLIRVKKSEYSFFLYGYIRYLYNQDEFFNLENGSSGIKNLDYKALLFENEYKMPDEESVLQFHSRVYHLYQKINQNKSQIRTLTALRDTLLPKLMSGEVRVEMSEKVRP